MMRSRSFSRALGATALLLAALSACASPDGGGAAPARDQVPADGALRAALTLDGQAFAAHEQPVVAVTVSNAGSRPEQLLRWYVTDDELAAPVLSVWRDGARVAYTGPLAKRTAPTRDDYVTLAPGASVTRHIDLAANYDLSQSGDYTVRLEVPSAKMRGGAAFTAVYVLSNDVALWAEGRPSTALKPGGGGGGGGGSGDLVTFTGRCSSAQMAQATEAVGVAGTMADGADAYLDGPASATPRYTTWFGAFSVSGWATASSNFSNIKTAFATQTINLDCKCKQKNVYAYVQANQPYAIFLCGAFWPAPMSGTDSKGGTLVHEMSHFNVVAGTADWAYGQTAARNLASTDPAKALDNADNHEYFAENTPALP